MLRKLLSEMRFGEVYDDDRDFDGDTDADYDRDPDGDVDVAHDEDGGSGFGRDRRAAPPSPRLPAFNPAFMPMTRRDGLSDLSRRSVEGTRRFLDQREKAEAATGAPGIALTGIEVLGGAALAGFLAQRFREAGAVVPVGVILGVLGLAGSQFEMFGKLSPDVRNLAIGALASAAALWAAGRGVISADALAAQQGAATGQQPAQFPQGMPQQGMMPQAQVPQQPPYYPPPQQLQQPPAQPYYAPQAYGYAAPVAVLAQFGYAPAPQPVQPSGPTMADLQNLLARRVAA